MQGAHVLSRCSHTAFLHYRSVSKEAMQALRCFLTHHHYALESGCLQGFDRPDKGGGSPAEKGCIRSLTWAPVSTAYLVRLNSVATVFLTAHQPRYGPRRLICTPTCGSVQHRHSAAAVKNLRSRLRGSPFCSCKHHRHLIVWHGAFRPSQQVEVQVRCVV